MSKSHTLDTGSLAEAFKALGHPHRLTMFLRLLGCCGGRRVCVSEGEFGACVGELGEGLGVGAPTLSHHLKDLRSAGLIETTRRGQMVECQASVERLKELAAFVQAALDAVDSATGCCSTESCGPSTPSAKPAKRVTKKTTRKSKPTTTGAKQ